MSVAIVENHGSAALQHAIAACLTPKNIPDAANSKLFLDDPHKASSSQRKVIQLSASGFQKFPGADEGLSRVDIA